MNLNLPPMFKWATKMMNSILASLALLCSSQVNEDHVNIKLNEVTDLLSGFFIATGAYEDKLALFFVSMIDSDIVGN
ncbi:hypothetical protein P8452_56861 [Trifolium repens]|nr:hypothetical protein QL285_094351 [Trifolium repens]WJX73035.1 hypothetical protein P8452_56861 [Trifolium repens]